MTVTDKSIGLSVPLDYELHGIRIRKLPIGRYLKAIQIVKNLPELLLKECFPGMKPDQVMERLKYLDEDALYQLVGQLVKVVPEQFLKLVSELIGADYEYIMDNLSPKELFEVLQEFWNANDMTDFFGQLKALLSKTNLTKALNFGSKN